MTKYNKKLLTTLEDRFDRLQAYLDRIFQFEEGEDLYAFIASIMYDKDVDECREVNPDGSPNPEGKERRNRAKQFILPVVVECGGISEEDKNVGYYHLSTPIKTTYVIRYKDAEFLNKYGDLAAKISSKEEFNAFVEAHASEIASAYLLESDENLEP